MGRLTGKVAMVTGSGGEHGCGRAIAGRLASDGADLILTDVERTGVRAIPGKSAGRWGGLAAVADEVRKHGGRALTALADVRSAAQVDAVVARALETFGHIDILVNNAGAPAGPDRAAVVELSEEAWDLVVGINLKGTFSAHAPWPGPCWSGVLAAATATSSWRGGRVVGAAAP